MSIFQKLLAVYSVIFLIILIAYLVIVFALYLYLESRWVRENGCLAKEQILHRSLAARFSAHVSPSKIQNPTVFLMEFQKNLGSISAFWKFSSTQRFSMMFRMIWRRFFSVCLVRLSSTCCMSSFIHKLMETLRNPMWEWFVLNWFLGIPKINNFRYFPLRFSSTFSCAK